MEKEKGVERDDGGPPFPTVSARERQALLAMAECGGDFPFMGFSAIADRSGLPREHVRRTVRSLKRKGLAQFSAGLWTDDGTPAGSGYACTDLGYDLADALLTARK